jgi:hypothetical protein
VSFISTYLSDISFQVSVAYFRYECVISVGDKSCKPLTVREYEADDCISEAA